MITSEEGLCSAALEHLLDKSEARREEVEWLLACAVVVLAGEGFPVQYAVDLLGGLAACEELAKAGPKRRAATRSEGAQ